MKRCPECHRFGVEFDPAMRMERCIWLNCLWINKDNIDVDKVEHPVCCQKFIDSITKKV